MTFEALHCSFKAIAITNIYEVIKAWHQNKSQSITLLCPSFIEKQLCRKEKLQRKKKRNENDIKKGLMKSPAAK